MCSLDYLSLLPESSSFCFDENNGLRNYSRLIFNLQKIFLIHINHCKKFYWDSLFHMVLHTVSKCENLLKAVAYNSLYGVNFTKYGSDESLNGDKRQS